MDSTLNFICICAFHALFILQTNQKNRTTMAAFSSTAAKVIGIQQLGREYVRRSAVRLVPRNDTNNIVLIWSEKGRYFKLSGGGVEDNEDHLIAAEREAMEETGCRVRVVKECVATCEEWRNELHQLSYCYRAQLKEDTGDVQLTEEEVQDGLKHQWCDAEEALGKCHLYPGKYPFF